MSSQLRHGPIARRVIEAVRRHMRMKVVDFAAFRAGQEQAQDLQNSITPKEQLAKTHPAHAAYVYAQNQMSVMGGQLLQMPEMKSFVKQIVPAEDEYAPSWPPMSPRVDLLLHMLVDVRSGNRRPPRDTWRRHHRRRRGMCTQDRFVSHRNCFANRLEDAHSFFRQNDDAVAGHLVGLIHYSAHLGQMIN
jgi:hypothetical protein